MLCEEGAGATSREEKDGRRRRVALHTATGTSCSAFPFASAAMDAASTARRSHLDVGTAAERRRLEKEAFRVSVHEHVRRELMIKSVEATSALAAVADAQ